MIAFLMHRLPPGATRTYPLLPFTPRSRSRGAEVAARDVDQVGDDGGRGGAIACARAFEEQPPDEIALGDDRIERARDMRERMIERNEVRMDALEQSGAVRLGDAHQPDAIAERRGLGDIGGDHLTNRSEEHTSELQSLMRISYAVFCLKKKTRHRIHRTKRKSKRNIMNLTSK